MRRLFAWTPSQGSLFSTKKAKNPLLRGTRLPSPLGRVPCPVSELSVLSMVGLRDRVVPRIPCRGGTQVPAMRHPCRILLCLLDLPKPCRSDLDDAHGTLTVFSTRPSLARASTYIVLPWQTMVAERALGCAPSSAFSSVPPTPTPHLRRHAADPGPVLSALQVSVTHMPSDCILARIFRAMAGSRCDVDLE